MSQPHVERTVAGYKFGHKLNGYVGGSLASHSITCLAALTKNEVLFRGTNMEVSTPCC